MRSFILACVLLLGAAVAGAQIAPTQQSPPASPNYPGEPGTPPSFPRQQIPPDQTIPDTQTPQAPAPQQVPPEEQPNPVAASNPITVQGCLSGSDGNYSIADATGSTFQLIGSDRMLSPYVGRTVQVTGTTSSGGTSVATPPDASTRPEAQENEPMEQTPVEQQPSVSQPATQSGQSAITVSTVKEVARSCSEGPQ